MVDWRDAIERRINTLHESSCDKRMELGEAVAQFVRPGMKLNFCGLQSRPSAAVYEICRQFRGKSPKFELISSSISGGYLALVHLGLIERAICSFAGEGYPTPGPSPITQRALADGSLTLENFTMLTIPQRLLAGAMGVPFLATRSLVGSTIGAEAERDGNFREIEDPFGSGRTVGLLRAYHPDIAFVHAWAADPAGNAICFGPLAENVYGALAAREGVVLTVDHIVDTEFIRRHSNLVRLPGSVVRSVSHCPYGAHPAGNFSQGVPEFRPYGNDYKFMIEHRGATKDPKAYDAWLENWVFGVRDHAAYIEKLGSERIEYLHHVAEPESWRDELEGFAQSLDEPRPSNAIEEMVVQAARMAARRITDEGYRTVLSGVGQATLLAWLAAHQLRDAGVEIDMMAETGIYGHDPRPSDPFVFNYRNLPTATMLTDIFETLALYTGGENNRCLGTIGAAQIDKHGNVNSTRAPGGAFIVGSGGANDISTAARETLVVVRQRRGAFVEKVEYITSPGHHIRAVISTMGRFEKRGGDELILTGYFGCNGADAEAAVAQIRDLVGWDLKVSDDLEALGGPTDEELALLRVFDPERFFLGKSVESPTAPAASSS